MDQFVFHNVFSVVTLCYSPMWAFLGGIAISFGVAVGLTLTWKIPDENLPEFEAASEKPPETVGTDSPTAAKGGETTGHEVTVLAPADGTLIELSSVPDQVFSSGVMGPGLAVRPTGDVVCAPATGTVTMLFETKHAVGITTAEGIELLVHIGLDTVELGGQGFEALVAQGEHVAAGQPLIRLDRTFFAFHGVYLDTPVIVSNPDAVQSVKPSSPREVRAGDPVMTIVL